ELEERANSLAELTAVFCVEPLAARDYPVLDTYLQTLTFEGSQVSAAQVLRDDGALISEFEQLTDEIPVLRWFEEPIVIRHIDDGDEDLFADQAGGSRFHPLDIVIGRVRLGFSEARLRAIL